MQNSDAVLMDVWLKATEERQVCSLEQTRASAMNPMRADGLLGVV